MTIPTEPIGSIPRPAHLIAAVARAGAEARELDALYDEAVRDTIERFEATGSPVVTDGAPQLLDIWRPGPAEHSSRGGPASRALRSAPAKFPQGARRSCPAGGAKAEIGE